MATGALVVDVDSFVPPTVKDHHHSLCNGISYIHHSSIPIKVIPNRRTQETILEGTPCVLGVDEAGRGPVIGPMVYGICYLPTTMHQSLLADKHHFDDSKVLTPAVRAELMEKLCTDDTDLYENCGFAVNSLSARDISAGMLRNGGSYNLNAQAMDATVETIRGVIEAGVNIQEIYVDTIGQPLIYQKKLEKIFPNIKITVEKKADSLFPCVSAASVVAKVTRDVSCEVLYKQYQKQEQIDPSTQEGWGSGYPSDARCSSWLKSSIDPVFGWGNECRFSWATVKDMLEAKDGVAQATDWPADDDDSFDSLKFSQYFREDASTAKTELDELKGWYGTSVDQKAF